MLNTTTLRLGGVGCDFAAATNIRRFAPPFDYPETTDTGWIFDHPRLSHPGNWTPAKAYLKFRINPNIDIDTNYFNPDGTLRQQLDDHGNWHFANGHQLRFEVVRVILDDAQGTVITDSEQVKQYAFIVLNSSDTLPAATPVKTTANDGSAQVYVKAGPNIQDAKQIIVGAVDLTRYLE